MRQVDTYILVPDLGTLSIWKCLQNDFQSVLQVLKTCFIPITWDFWRKLTNSGFFSRQNSKSRITLKLWEIPQCPPKSKVFSLKKVRGAYISELLIFFQNIDFWAIKWLEEAKNIFFWKFRTFSKDPHRIFAKFWFWVVLSGSLKMHVLQKMTFSGSWNRQKPWESHFSQKKSIFSKV